MIRFTTDPHVSEPIVRPKTTFCYKSTYMLRMADLQGSTVKVNSCCFLGLGTDNSLRGDLLSWMCSMRFSKW